MTKETGRKIKALRKALKENQDVFGERFKVEQATVSRWEKGSQVHMKYFDAIAELAGMTVAEFFHSSSQPRTIQITGYVGAGEKFTPIADGALDTITFDLEADEIIAVQVRGDSMSPAYRNGDILICSRIDRR